MLYHLHQWLTHRWTKESRYYVAEVSQDLFGNWLHRRTWGSLTTHSGQSRTHVAEDYGHAMRLMHETEKRREKRGYNRVNG